MGSDRKSPNDMCSLVCLLTESQHMGWKWRHSVYNSYFRQVGVGGILRSSRIPSKTILLCVELYTSPNTPSANNLGNRNSSYLKLTLFVRIKYTPNMAAWFLYSLQWRHRTSCMKCIVQSIAVGSWNWVATYYAKIRFFCTQYSWVRMAIERKLFACWYCCWPSNRL